MNERDIYAQIKEETERQKRAEMIEKFELAKREMGGRYVVYWTAISNKSASYNKQTQARSQGHGSAEARDKLYDQLVECEKQGKLYSQQFITRVTKADFES